MRPVLKYILIVTAVLISLFMALWEYSSDQDQKNFSAAKNDCERGCIQDSGGLKQCREFCVNHPDHYP